MRLRSVRHHLLLVTFIQTTQLQLEAQLPHPHTSVNCLVALLASAAVLLPLMLPRHRRRVTCAPGKLPPWCRRRSCW